MFTVNNKNTEGRHDFEQVNVGWVSNTCTFDESSSVKCMETN